MNALLPFDEKRKAFGEPVWPHPIRLPRARAACDRARPTGTATGPSLARYPRLAARERSGEYGAELALAGRRSASLAIGARLAEREAVPDLWLAFAPIKRARVDWLAEKACEIGVARLIPVLTRRTVIDRLNLDRLRAHMIEAAEQCGRTALPELDDPLALDALLGRWPAERALLFADEEGGVPLAQAAAPPPAALLIGPEGGFDAAERAAIRALPQATAISLGPRVLRAETAALAALAVCMATTGDWRSRGAAAKRAP